MKLQQKATEAVKSEKEQTLPRQTAKNIAPEVEESRNLAA